MAVPEHQKVPGYMLYPGKNKHRPLRTDEEKAQDQESWLDIRDALHKILRMPD